MFWQPYQIVWNYTLINLTLLIKVSWENTSSMNLQARYGNILAMRRALLVQLFMTTCINRLFLLENTGHSCKISYTYYVLLFHLEGHLLDCTKKIRKWTFLGVLSLVYYALWQTIKHSKFYLGWLKKEIFITLPLTQLITR